MRRWQERLPFTDLPVDLNSRIAHAESRSKWPDKSPASEASWQSARRFGDALQLPAGLGIDLEPTVWVFRSTPRLARPNSQLGALIRPPERPPSLLTSDKSSITLCLVDYRGVI
jgi:hypothetical protein